MKMPFGPHRGVELDEVPDSTLRWIVDKLVIEPGDSAPPNLRDEWRMRNQQLKQEARRILVERRRNGVRVENPQRSFGGKRP